MTDSVRKFSKNELPDLAELLSSLDLTDCFKGELALFGRDPIIGSPHRLGYATATATGLNTILASMIWEQRTGKRNNISIDIKDLNPKGIVYLSVSCYGDKGLWKDRSGFETIGQVCSGFSIDEANGDADNPLFSPVLYLNDPLTGNFAFSGVLTALRRRAIEGGSYHVKVSLVRTAMWVQSLGLLSSPDYMNLPRQDINTPRLETMDTPFGEIKHLSLPYTFDNMTLPTISPVLPFGASKAEF